MEPSSALLNSHRDRLPTIDSNRSPAGQHAHHLPPITTATTHLPQQRMAPSAIYPSGPGGGGGGGSGNGGANFSSEEFHVTPEQLGNIVNFDERSNPEQVKFFNSKYGGVEGLRELLRTNLDRGLPVAPASEQTSKQKGIQRMVVCDGELRRKSFGENVVPPPKSNTVLEIVWETIKEDPIIKILILGAVVVTAIGIYEGTGWIEGIAILVAVIIVLSVTAGNDYSKDKTFKKLLLLQSDKKTKVLRGGKVDQISSWDVLVGDVIELAVGDEIPADGVFVRGSRLVVDESPLTGESVPVKKSARSPFLFSGCQVNEGSGFMLATAVGPRSSGGKIQAILSEAQNNETVLQFKLRDVAVLIGKVGFSAGIITFVGLCIRFGIEMARVYPGQSPPITEFMRLVNFFNVSVTIIVVAVPEGLPLAVTISLAFSMFKMIKDRCFVRHLEASETMGEATAICSDKTGTLTENRMTVVKTLLGHSVVHGSGSGEPDEQTINPNVYPRRIREFLAEAMCINSTCFLKTKQSGTGTEQVFVGSATEGALLLMAQSMGHDYEGIRRSVPKVENAVFLFTSDRKRMSTLCEPRTPIGNEPDPALFRLYTKGASEIVLKLCTYVLSSDGQFTTPMTEDAEMFIRGKIRAWAGEGLRTLAIAYRDYSRPLTRAERDDPENNLTFIGLVGIKDPVRGGVPEAVRICQDAGIVVRMVTGDNILTASKISRECHILSDAGVAMEGPVFRALSVAEKKAVIPRLQVLARSSPADKHTLVSLLKEMGEVVAVTGDGTNDAPALKEADVGFAMGISGTQIAMNASDIILLDDNFVSIVQSIKWGRNVLCAVRKFLQFQLSVNLVAVGITIVGSLAQSESPLNPVQLLWVNLIMDTLGALALASDVPDRDILKASPNSRTEPIITNDMAIYIGLQTSYQMIALLVLMFKGHDLIYFDPTFHVQVNETTWLHSVLFTTFVLMQLVNEVLARQLHHELNFLRGILDNRLFLSILAVILVVQVLMVQYANLFMGTVVLAPYEWGVSFAVALVMIPYMLIARGIVQLWRHAAGLRVLPVAVGVEPIDKHTLRTSELVAMSQPHSPTGEGAPLVGGSYQGDDEKEKQFDKDSYHGRPEVLRTSPALD